MKNGNILQFSTEKIKIKRKPFQKVNIFKNTYLMNLPEFHCNRTIKAYINNRLKKNNNLINKSRLLQNKTENNIFPKKNLSKNKPEKSNNKLIRINTSTNILNRKKYYSKEKANKITKVSYTPKSDKKIYKSNSKSKFNISYYIFNYRKKNNLNNNLNLSAHKNRRNTGSTTLSINATSQLADKTISIYRKDNQITSNDSTLELRKRKNKFLYVHTTSKKNKFNNQFFPEEKKIKIKFSKLNRLKTKTNEIKDINMNKTKNNNRMNINLDNSFSKKSFNNNSEKNENINLNYINNTENNIIYTKSESNHIYFHDCNISDKALSKFNNYSHINSKSIDINIQNTNQKTNDNYTINNYNSQNNSNFEYIQKIQKLEDENKLLKYEINDSKYKLKILEEKINKLLLGKNSINSDKEECPQPTPYVKKYTESIFNNNNKSNFN